MNAILSVVIFVIAYIIIATEKMDKSTVTIIASSLVIFLHLVPFNYAMKSIDMNVIFLLVGMMTCVDIISRTGFFQWLALSVAKKAKGNPILIMILMLLVTGFLSAFFANVTTIMLLVPLTILITQLLEINPVPLIIGQALVSNITGTATLIGDPPNIIIGSQAHYSFTDFLVGLTPVILVVLGAFLLTMFVIFRKKFVVSDSVKMRVIKAIPELAIVDKKNMRKSLIVLAFIFAGFFLPQSICAEPGIIALFGSMIMMVVCRSDSDDTLMRVEWGVIFFFIGMFIMTSALVGNGVIAALGNLIIRVFGHHFFLICMVIMVGSAILSGILDNIPYVITMVPLVKNFIIHFSHFVGHTDPAYIATHIAQPLWWSLALGACLGGNMTIIGSSPNVVAVKMSERNKYPISFGKFMQYGVPFTIQSIVISGLYIWIRYFLLMHR